MLKRYLLSLILLCTASFAYGALHLELTQGIDSAIPIAIVPFGGQSTDTSVTNVANVITADLQNSGRFRALDSSTMMQFPHATLNVDRGYWKSVKVNLLVVGSVKPLAAGQYQVSFGLIDLYAKPVTGANPTTQGVLATQTFTTTKWGLRKLAHHISDIIYQKVMGRPGIFSTKIAYVVMANSNSYRLEVADYDGYNPQVVLHSPQPIMSPAWSPDGKRLAYVSFEKQGAAIYISDLTTGKRTLISHYPGVNSAPAFSPDGKSLALVLSLSGALNIYEKNLLTGALQQLTHDTAIDTEPAFSPDGSSLVFTSDKGGAPQIYRLNFANKQVSRITYDGNYNARASFTADGSSLVVLHRTAAGVYSVAMQDLSSGRLRVLAQPPYTQTPSVAPNGDMVIYSLRDENGQFLLGMVSSDGRVQLRLPLQGGSVYEPAWSPYLK